MIVPLLVIDGTPLSPQPYVAVVGGRTVVPIRDVAAALGEHVAYDGSTKTVAIFHAGQRRTVRIAMVHAGRALAYADELGPLLHAEVTEDAAHERVTFARTMVMAPRPVPSVEVRYGAGATTKP